MPNSNCSASIALRLTPTATLAEWSSGVAVRRSCRIHPKAGSHILFADHKLADSRRKCNACVDPAAFVGRVSGPSLLVLTRSFYAITSGCVMLQEALRDRLASELARRQLASGGWSTNPTSRQAALEPTCLATLAAGSRQDVALTAQKFLLRVQNPNGSWPAFDADDHDASCATSLAIITLRDSVPGIPARLRAFHWLLTSAGKESSWFWKWKFRTTDRHVRFDPDKYGWPWCPDTLSWVVPTSFAILALNQIPCTCGDFGQAEHRARLGVEMLMDRACPGGGWNAGNGMVYGEPLAPHLDDTAVALLALSDRAADPLVQSGAQWLERTVQTVRSPWSLAWSVLALAAHGRSIEFLLAGLRSLPDPSALEDTSTLAVVALALRYDYGLSAFGVET